MTNNTSVVGHDVVLFYAKGFRALPVSNPWLMLLLLLPKKKFSSFAWSSICSMFLDFFVLFCDARRPRGFPKAESLLVEGLGVGGGVLSYFHWGSFLAEQFPDLVLSGLFEFVPNKNQIPADLKSLVWPSNGSKDLKDAGLDEYYLNLIFVPHSKALNRAHGTSARLNSKLKCLPEWRSLDRSCSF